MKKAILKTHRPSVRQNDSKDFENLTTLNRM